MGIKNKIINKLIQDYLKETYSDKMRIQALETINVKAKLKKMADEKIHVVFVCHRPAVWDALASVFSACACDDAFRVTLVAIPNKKQDPKLGLAHEMYVSEGAEEFFKSYVERFSDSASVRLINGYDYDKKTWIDLQTLNPDYVFFQTGYDICRPPEYKSDRVSLFTKLAYVHYGMPFMDGMIAEESFPISFLENVYFHFAEFEEMQKYYVDRVPENVLHKHARVALTGYPKLDAAKNYVGCDSDNWKFHGDEQVFRVMWTPRWNTQENNSTFFELKDAIVDYFTQKADDAGKVKAELLFRPHPQAFSEWVTRGEMTAGEAKQYRDFFLNGKNLSLDEKKDYLQSFYSSDVLITDESSIIPEYFLSGKPLIFTYKETHLNAFATKISEGFYWAKNWEEVGTYLRMLEAGEDPKKELRERLIQEAFYIPADGSGFEIKELLKRDFANS